MNEHPHPIRLAPDDSRDFVVGDAENHCFSSTSLSPTVSSASAGRKRKAEPERYPRPQGPDNGKAETCKIRKVSRACDFCKSRKARCTGDQPCAKCIAKGRVCSYEARYTRGRPPTPPLSDPQVKAASTGATVVRETQEQLAAAPLLSRPSVNLDNELEIVQQCPPLQQESNAPSRASPELSMAEIQGQMFDPTSGLTFLHRALSRLSAPHRNGLSETSQLLAEQQLATPASDKPLAESDGLRPFRLPEPADGRKLLALYFDVCIATYRILHQPTVERWLESMEQNLREKRSIWYGVGRGEAAIVLIALAVARLHHEKSKGFSSAEDEEQALKASDELYTLSTQLAVQETGFPRLELAQSRIVHVLYLLSTSRFNRAWYAFGNALQLVAALGLHRRVRSKRRRTLGTDYIRTQCGIRTFWTAYILDNYLGVIFGRPRHFHDQDIDQVYPDQVSDHEMTVAGPESRAEKPKDCHIDALLFHAKIAQIVGSISREVYTLQDIPKSERDAAATKLIQRVNQWHSSLPLHLGSIPPSLLITSYRRQATVLKLAHSHAIMQATRLFLLGNSPNTHESHVTECIDAAKAVLEVVDQLSYEGPIFHAFWWTHYVAFCALVIIYVWEIQQRRAKRPIEAEERNKLMEMAERCQSHLAYATASNSPSRRYAAILQEFRAAASISAARPSNIKTEGQQKEVPPHPSQDGMPETPVDMSLIQGISRPGFQGAETTVVNDDYLLDQWQTTDWLDIDSWMPSKTSCGPDIAKNCPLGLQSEALANGYYD
ncbi:hypothetical protein FZEAL_1905 [Fusarium zealandicum]|uniref:Zn(2)-C6 fungal-type domain-containing protein n=1 Tax=Fusarium zealandicum TaxID=1053134 RepID=A0A8H4USC0_9HYPO|nr:hypothetical protein FZEAL_1905 [Fusarium zealandicum]